MDIQPHPVQHPTELSESAEQARDLTWLGMADDRELLCLAREIAANNQYVNRAAKVFDGVTSKLRLIQG